MQCRKVAIAALKGGVGKSSISAGLGLALKDKGLKVGFLDIDITGSSLYSALGLKHSPQWELNTAEQKIIVPEVDGYWLLSIASYAGEKFSILFEISTNSEMENIRNEIRELAETIGREGINSSTAQVNLTTIYRKIDDILAASKWRFVTELLSDDIVTWPQPLDYLIADLPPSTSNEMFSYFEHVKDLFGVVIVSQPTEISNIGLVKTIDLLKVRHIPIIGVVANQDGFLNKHGEIEYQFLSPRVDLEKISKDENVPFLLSIPQCSDISRLKTYFNTLSEKVMTSKPIVLKDVTMMRKIKRRIVEEVARRI